MHSTVRKDCTVMETSGSGFAFLFSCIVYNFRPEVEPAMTHSEGSDDETR